MSGPSDDHKTTLNDPEYLYGAWCIGNVTHDVNNYLGAIMAYAELIAEEVEGSAEVQGMVQEMLGAVEKSAELLDTIAELLGTRETTTAALDVADLFRKLANLHAHDFKRARIVFELNVEGEGFAIPAIRRRLSRLFMLVLRDAIDRLEPEARKSIRVKIHAEPDALRVVFRDSAERVAVIPEPESAQGGNGRFEPLARAREHAECHGGELTCTGEEGIVLRLPRENGLL